MSDFGANHSPEALSASAEGFINNVNSFQRSQLDHVRETTDCGDKTYAEVHDTPHGPVIIASPIPAEGVQYASVDGFHSIADEVRLDPLGRYPEFRAFIDDPKHYLDVATVIAKGELVKNEDSTIALVLDNFRGSNAEGTVFASLHNNRYNIGLDGGLARSSMGLLTPLDIQPGLSTKALISAVDYLPSTSIPVILQTTRCLVGLVTRIETLQPRIEEDYRSGKHHLQNNFALKVLEADSKLHDPLYRHIDIDREENPLGLLPIVWRGEPIDVGVKYAVDKSANPPKLEVNVMFSKETEPKKYHEDIANMLAAACVGLTQDIAEQFTYTVSYGNNVARTYPYA